MTTDDEKRTYIQRIDKKAYDENIPLKLAARKLGLKDWRYWKYKNDLKQSERDTGGAPLGRLPVSERATTQNERVNISPTSAASGPAVEIVNERPTVNISFDVTADVYEQLVKKASVYALSPSIIAKIILHDAVRKNGVGGGKSESVSHDMGRDVGQAT
jgi:hypothetical protein